jgi:hypothetical protein
MNLTTISNIHFQFQIVGKENPDEDWVYVKMSNQRNGVKHSILTPHQ